MKIHLRYDGKSTTVNGPEGTDQEVIHYLQQRGLLPPRADTRANSAPPLMIDRHPEGLVIRPPAVFG